MSQKQRKVLYRIIASTLLLIAAALIPSEGITKLLIFIVPYGIIGYDILLKAAKNISKGQIFDENFLMSIATIGAFALGDYAEAVFVMLFYQVGELFQSYAVGKSRKSIAELMDIRPDYANIEKNGAVEQVDPYEISVGEQIIVKPGEKVPLDGVIVEGSSSVDTSALTGESVPKDLSEGDSIISGCINKTGLLKVEVTKEFDESTVSKILDLVENASTKKARDENFITRFSRYYTPIVVFSAVILAIIPPLFFGGQWGEWIERALIFLVISCPCALVISIPLSFFGGIGGASKKGILVKGGNYLEALAEADVMVFDKTGTLTKGEFAVTDIHCEDAGRDELIEYAAMAEHYSDHPISGAIKELYKNEIELDRIKDFENIAGYGVKAVVDGKTVYAGNAKLMNKISAKFKESSDYGSIVYVVVEGVYKGYILINDELKPDTKESIRQLKAMGIKKTVMLTGDGQKAAEHIARESGIDEVHAQLLPGEKVDIIEQVLAEKKGNVVFVGYGINDAPVLSRSDVGIAMGGLGSDAAIEAADIVLMDDKPSNIPEAIRIARKTNKIVKQNIVIALGFKVIVLALGAFGIANMWSAIFADVGVMLIAVVNASRTLKP